MAKSNVFSVVNEIVETIDKDAKLASDTNMFLNFKTGAELGSLPIALDLMRIVGPGKLAQMPYPNSIPPDKVGVKGWGQGKVSTLPDRYVTQDADGNDVVGSRWKDLCRQSAIGKALLKQSSEIADNMDDAEDKVDEGSAKSAVNKRLTNLELLYLKAGKIVHQLVAFAAAEHFGCQIKTETERPTEFIFDMPEVPQGSDVPWIVDGKKRYLTTKNMCIRVFGKRDNGQGGVDFHSEKYVSLGTFLGYDVAEALRVGGEVKHLYKTIKRDTKAPGLQQSTVKGVKDFFDRLVEQAAWLKQGVGSERYITMLNYMNTTGNDSAIYAAGQIMDDLGAAFEKVRNRYEAQVLAESTIKDAAADVTKGKAA